MSRMEHAETPRSSDSPSNESRSSDLRSLSPRYRGAAVWIIVAAIAMLAGHLCRVQSTAGRTPFLSANDRSRWATVRALLEHGTYVLDAVSFTAPLPEDDGGPRPPRAKRDAEWHSIDMVRHRGTDGREHYYSSKPPLLATVVAGVCRVVELATGARLADNPKYVGRLTLAVVNLLPLAFAWWLLARMLAAESRTLAGRTFVMAAAAFGTLLGPMAVTLNNHIPAAVATQAALFALWRLLGGACGSATWPASPASRAWPDWQSRTGWTGWKASLAAWRRRLKTGSWSECRWAAAVGGAAALATAFELPALSLLAILGLVVGVAAPRGWVVGFVPAAIAVGAVALGLNYAAHGQWAPAYANRADGPVLATFAERPWRDSLQASARVTPALRDALRQAGVEVSAAATHRPATASSDGSERWTLWDPETQRRWAVVARLGQQREQSEQGGEDQRGAQGRSGQLECREWRNWYDYEGTYWTPERLRGVDRGEPSRWTYLFHATFGHHGLFSVTPVWLLSLAGGWLAWRRGGWRSRLWAALAGLLTVVCLTFYVARPLIDRNYGGVSCGFRWLFWLIPLWCLPMAGAADAMLRRRWGRVAAAALLGASAFSAAWSATKPWSHPWIYDYWASLGWLGEI